MGSVWRAEHLELRSPLAIKVLEAEIASDPAALQRFLREAQTAAALRSPNVVQIFDYGAEAGQAFIAMELLQGESLSERIARLGRVPPEELFRFLGEILRAVHKAHEAGIIHRDLKPDNVFVVKDEPEFAKILDFGVAKVQKGVLGEATGFGTQTGMMLGTPYYMSPEQAQAKGIDRRSDLWSIAVIAFEALLGQRPFRAESLGDLVIAICTQPTPVPSRVGPVPPGFDEWFVRGTQRDPARRFASARDMAEELEQVSRSMTDARLTTTRGLVHGPMLAGLSSPPGPSGRPSAAPSNPLGRSRPGTTRPTDARDLALTTGQRSALTRLPSESSPRGSNGALLLLLAFGALILVGAAVFVLSGGARALHEAEIAHAPGRAAVAPPAAPTLALPNPELAPAAGSVTPRPNGARAPR